MSTAPISDAPPNLSEPRSALRGWFFWKLFLGNAAVLTLVLGACLWTILAQLDEFHEAELISFLRSQATALRGVLEPQWIVADAVRLDRMVKELSPADTENVRITLIGPDGRVWADSSAEPATLDSHADRPEIVQARAEGWGAATRWSESVRRDMQYVALTVGPPTDVRGYVRVAVPLGVVSARTGAVHRLVWAIGLSGLAAALLLALGLAVLWSGRISRITAAARGISRGDLGTRLHMGGKDEVALLARSLDRMRNRIAAQMSTIDGQRLSLEALLEQLSEGVVVVRQDGRVHWINAAARRLLSVPNDVTGSAVERYVSQHDVQRMLLEPLNSRVSADGAAEARLDLSVDGKPVALLARASEIMLPGVPTGGTAGDERVVVPGRLLVLTDITELSRAIRLRTDFAANASHELRTPLAAMRGAAETLQKMNLAEESAVATRFVNMIVRHLSRLEDLVSDLLNLSRLESPGACFKPVDLRTEKFVAELTDRWRDNAETKNVAVAARVDAECRQLRASPHLLRLALDNLVDNAIKFSEPNGTVSITVNRVGDRIVFRVRDQGCGIPDEDQERVFERFYQVARARTGTGSPSDQVRGTGLGLSIVRHAVTALAGEVQLESAVGTGTTITVDIPIGQVRVVLDE